MTLDEIAELREGELRYAYCFAVMAVAPELIEVARACGRWHGFVDGVPMHRPTDGDCQDCYAIDALERKLGSSASSTHKPR